MDETYWAVLGPTAVGKTELAIALADRFPIEVVNLDSRQIYVGMDIGTAKPTPAQRSLVPHHMLDLIPPNARWDALQYSRRAREAIAQIRARGRIPLVVGGAGFYFAALRGELHEDLPQRDEALRSELTRKAREEGPEALWELLRAKDPETASSLHPRDTVRVIRALEVVERSGIPLSARRRTPPRPWGKWAVVVVGMPRELHQRRIRQRAREMVRRGWPEEVRELMRQGYTRSDPGLQTLGYPQMWDYVSGRLPLEEALEQVAVRTWQYARRQITWFRRFPAHRWVEVEGGGDVVDRVVALLTQTP